jgi:hypothetical protein
MLSIGMILACDHVLPLVFIYKEGLRLDRTKMKNITIALPEIYVNNIEKLQDIGMVPSRSEAIRLAIRDFLKKEMHVLDLLGFERKVLE